MANLRTGRYGFYYGSYFNQSEALTNQEMEDNGLYIYEALSGEGWTMNAIAGMLGNMQAESSINPGRWQSEDVGNTSLGYGLVQWTPATKYLDYCSQMNITDASEMDANLSRIVYEVQNGLQWISTSEYPLSFEEFTKSKQSPSYLASAFLKCYERAGVEVESTRRANAEKWYQILENEGGSVNPDPPSFTLKKGKKFKFTLFQRGWLRNGSKRF